MALLTSLNAQRSLMADEGFMGRPYKCPAGKLTIMYGRNIDANPFTPEEGQLILERQVDQIASDLQIYFGEDLWMEMGEWRRVALINMVYQLGMKGLMGFRKTLALIKRKEYVPASLEATNSLWAEQTPHRAGRVVTALGHNVNAWEDGNGLVE
jgi:lysozyme